MNDEARAAETRRIERRMRKAERRLARGVDTRKEAGGLVSESVILARLKRQLNGGE